MRNQKLRDAAILLPLAGAFLLLPVVLRLVSGGRWWPGDLPSLPAYLYLIWLLLIAASVLLSRWLLQSESRSDADGSAPGGTTRR